MSFSSDKFIQAKIMQLVDQDNPDNFRFTSEFESAVENKLSLLADIKTAFKSVAQEYAIKANVTLTDLEIAYAADLFIGINPWNKT